MNTIALYSDGKTSRLTQTEIEILPHGISIFDSDKLSPTVLLYEDIKQLENTKQQTILYFGTSAPYQNISIKEQEARDQFDRYTSHLNNTNDSHRKFNNIGPLAYIGGPILAIGLLAFFYLVVIPGARNAVISSIPVSYEIDLGKSYASTFQSYGSIDTSKSRLLNEFAQEMSLQTDYPIHLNYLDNEMVNAFALPGGEIFVFEGIMQEMDSYEQLVALIGHETGHVVYRHGLKHQVEQYSTMIIIQLLTGASDDNVQAILSNAAQLKLLSYSRDAEREADNFGYDVMINTQTNPRGIVELFEKLESHSHSNEATDLLDFMSTHPNISERIESANIKIDEQLTLSHKNEKLEAIFNRLKQF